MTLSFVTGTSDFEKIQDLHATHGSYYVDKSLFIREIFSEKGEVILIPRPRRFGKTLNLSMLFEFLSNPQSKPWFEKLKINQYPDLIAELGTHPTIFLSFKDAKQTTYLEAFNYLAQVMSETYSKFRFLLEKLEPDQQKYFTRILEKKTEGAELNRSLFSLSQWLSTYFNKRVWILLDEYDAPIHSGWQCDYYQDIVAFMQSFLGAAFKDNFYLYRGVMTGILRVSRENIFSGLNNVSVYSMLNPQYAEYFGFTESELDLICELGDLKHERDNIRTWYNGYQIKNTPLYNPWSIAKYVTEREFKPYWVNTSNNFIVKKLIACSGESVKEKFELLMQDQAITVDIDEHCVLPGIEGNETEALWSFLLFSGYLKLMKVEFVGIKARCLVSIPNLEIKYLYQDQLSNLFPAAFSSDNYLKMLKVFTEGDVPRFSNYLKTYLETSMSYFDSGREEPERFYHGFVLGILVSLRETHWVKSNRESGSGRYDIMVIPKDKNKLGIIIEFKVALSGDQTEMQNELEEALNQIELQNYALELKDQGIRKILKLAIVFYKKQMLIKSAH